MWDYASHACVRCQPAEGTLTPDVVNYCHSRYSEHLYRDYGNYKPKVIVALGQEALYALTGSSQDILDMRGYPIWDNYRNLWIMPTVHPDYLREGHSNYGAVILHDVKRAVEIAKHGLIHPQKLYSMTPEEFQWKLDRAYVKDPNLKIAFDIETPWKNEDEGESDYDELKEGQKRIDRISFAFQPHEAISLDYNLDNYYFIKYVLSHPAQKVVWNEAFDVPILRHHGLAINGIIHDGMVMWHVLHPDLPKKLGFAATFLTPHEERWKHLSHVDPEFYNAKDSDVALQCVLEAERQLKAEGRWNVYKEQVLYVNLPLTYMSNQGMPVNPEKRIKAAEKLEDLLDTNFDKIQEATKNFPKKIIEKQPRELPEGATWTTYMKLKKVKQCNSCKAWPVTKSGHTKKKCALGKPDIKELVATVEVRGYFPAFNANSPQQILAYFKHAGIKPIIRKGKPTTDEKALKQLQAKHPEDPLIPLVLERRKLEKLAGTYVGRLECE